MHLGGLLSTQEVRVALGYPLVRLLRFFLQYSTLQYDKIQYITYGTYSTGCLHHWHSQYSSYIIHIFCFPLTIIIIIIMIIIIIIIFFSLLLTFLRLCYLLHSGNTMYTKCYLIVVDTCYLINSCSYNRALILKK